MSNRVFLSIILLALPVTSYGDGQPAKGVVLIPGAGSSGPDIYIQNIPNLLGSRYFGKFQETFAEQGIDSIVCPATRDKDSRTIEEREAECVENIHEHFACAAGGRELVLIGHSMGGLVARELAQDPAVSSCIKSVLTISTPNQGTPFADFTMDHLHNFFDFFGFCAWFSGFTPEHTRYLPQLRVDRSRDSPDLFQAQDIADNPDIGYFSISTSFTNDFTSPLEIMKQVIDYEMHHLGLDKTSFGDHNDGIVPEYSMVHGTYLGHLQVNHWESACVDPVRDTAGCAATLGLVVPFVKSQLGQN